MARPPPARAVALAAPLGWDAAAFAWPALCALAAAGAVLPLWVGRFLPFQDAPQHLAAIRRLADYDVPAFAFRRWFEIDPARSQTNAGERMAIPVDGTQRATAPRGMR